MGLHLTEIFELQHLNVAAVVEFDNALLAVDGEELAGLLLVLVTHDHLHLVPQARHHGRQVVGPDTHRPRHGMGQGDSGGLEKGV